MMVCVGQFLDANNAFFQPWHTSFILKWKWTSVTQPGLYFKVILVIIGLFLMPSPVVQKDEVFYQSYTICYTGVIYKEGLNPRFLYGIRQSCSELTGLHQDLKHSSAFWATLAMYKKLNVSVMGSVQYCILVKDHAWYPSQSSPSS